MKRKKTKEERKRDREIVGVYHKKLTEDKLEGLYENFQKWRNGQLPYYDLTEHIHQFHKEDQKIWSLFNYNGWDDELLIYYAKRDLNLLNEKGQEKDE